LPLRLIQGRSGRAIQYDSSADCPIAGYFGLRDQE
jgi:hypothetical protein